MDNNEPIKAEIILYQSGETNVPVEVRYMNETFWLTQEEIAVLFDVGRTVVSKHLRNIVSKGELELEPICAKTDVLLSLI